MAGTSPAATSKKWLDMTAIRTHNFLGCPFAYRSRHLEEIDTEPVADEKTYNPDDDSDGEIPRRN